MTHGSLFSGIGGFDLAARWMGWENAFHCEIDGFCTRILKYHFPDAIHYEDITKTDFSEWRGRIDILSGGFPCQPFSLAGRRRGAEDDRYLWPQMLRAVREIRPAWVVGENVAGILTMVQPGEEVEVGGEASLFGEGDIKRTQTWQEYVVETVCRDLEREGYSVRPFVIPACAVGAPHRRDRVWFVAKRESAVLRPSDNPDFRDDMRKSGEDARARTEERIHERDKIRESGESGGVFGHSSHRADAGVKGQCGRKDGIYAGGPVADTQCCGGREMLNEVQPGQPDGQRAYGNGVKRPDSYTHGDRLRYGKGEQVSVSECEGASRHSGACKDGPASHSDDRRKPPRPAGGETEGGGRRHNLQPGERRNQTERADGLHGLSRDAAYAQRVGRGACEFFDGKPEEPQQAECGEQQLVGTDCPQDRWRDFPTQPPVCGRDDGLSSRLDGITFPKWRQESIKAYGNAIVPQVAYEIFRAIEGIE